MLDNTKESKRELQLLTFSCLHVTLKKFDRSHATSEIIFSRVRFILFFSFPIWSRFLVFPVFQVNA